MRVTAAGRKAPVVRAASALLLRRRITCTAAAMAAAVVGLPCRGARCLSVVPGAKGVPWPDLRLWVRRLPDGTAAIARQRGPDTALAFDAYSQPRPGTREVRLGDSRFFAFTGPRLGAEHMVVWRRVHDVHATAEQQEGDEVSQQPSAFELDGQLPMRLTSCTERAQLTAALWCWDDLGKQDPNRFWDDGAGGGPWMYWESFWAPAEAAALATASPAFGDAAGRMLAPTLGTATAQRPVGRAAPPDDDFLLRAQARAAEEGVAPSTATATAQKDRAYAVVYRFNVWGSDVSRSGTGSDLWSPEARLAVTALEAVVDRFGVRSLLDCACGDATWMLPFFVARHPEVTYCGVDIVPEVIEQNRRRYPGVQFVALDAAEAPLPEGADLVFSKETLNHMGVTDAQQALDRFKATGARYLLTNVHEGAVNEEGYVKPCYTTYVKYDYELPPFNMKKVASVIEYQGLNTSFSLFELNAP
mmetsp:Transcript_112734/g.352572  ORF Transcript_112734/g.352572 Transcript_112734/m.352572 type:complete len:473 (-) Transcript_112734:174-1592(-)